jgi:hypothetical protein
MFTEVSEADRAQIAVLVGALRLKAHKAIKTAYPHLKGIDQAHWIWLFLQSLLYREVHK